MSTPGTPPAIADPADAQLPDPLPADPLPLAHAWFREAAERAVQPNPNAMTLATIDPDGRPSARVVLCRGFDPARGILVFHSNRTSRKGTALAAHPRAAVVMHWDTLDRQIRAEGPVTHSPARESDEYFTRRPLDRRLGAWASDQSRPLPNRHALLERVAEVMTRFGVSPLHLLDSGPANAGLVPRPPHWGGYRIWIERIELWHGVAGRLHDRAEWRRTLTPAEVDGAPGYTPAPGNPGAWSGQRLFP